MSQAPYTSTKVSAGLLIKNEVFQGYTNRGGDNRFFGQGIDQLYRVLRHDPLIRKINSLPYYSASVDQGLVVDLNQQFTEHLENMKVREQMEAFTLHLAQLMIAQIQMLNPKKILLTGNVFDYNDFLFHKVKSHILKMDQRCTTPQKSNATYLDQVP